MSSTRTILPPALSQSPSLYIAHTAGRVAREPLEAGIKLLEQAGLRVVHDASIGTSPGYLAASDAERAADLIHGLVSPDFDAVLCARGGYGAMRIIPRLAPDLLERRPRWIVGYSDITALHLWAFGQGVATLHAPMAAGLAKHAGDCSLEATLTVLRGGAPPSFDGLRCTESVAMTAPMVGGNLSLLAAMAATTYWPHRKDVILFVEEVGEPRYRLDRMAQTLLMGGHLEHVVGIVLGQFTGCGDNGEREEEVIEFVTDLFRPLGVPVMSRVPSGHGTPNLPWIHGAPYAFDGAAGRLAPSPEPVSPSAPSHTKGATAAFVPSRVRSTPGNLFRIVKDAHERGVTSALSLDVSVGSEVLIRLVSGTTAATDDVTRRSVTPTTWFDLASVTKAISTAVLAHHAIETGKLRLDDRVPRSISRSEATLRDLLRHTSGLPAWLHIFKSAREADDPLEAAHQAFADVEAASPGSPCYSDVGYVALGRWVEYVLGESLPTLFQRVVAAPLGLTQIGFGSDGAESVAATEWCPWRRQTLVGVVHDENAQVLGGAAGHAGLFGTAAAVGAIGRSLLGFGPAILGEEAVARMWDRGEMVDGGTHTLGWDTPSGKVSSAGDLLSRDNTFGHLGFTGTSIWLDRSRALSVVLLTNRVHPRRDEARIRELRRAIHDEVTRIVDRVRG